MDIAIRASEEDMIAMAETNTYQTPFLVKDSCKICRSKESVLILIVNDSDKVLAKSRPNKVKIWPHDSTAIAIYLCTDCGRMTALWNQA